MGDLLGLRWRDIDLISGSMRIEHSLWRGELGTPKTEGSSRTVPLGARLKAVLLAHRGSQHRATADFFVFCKEDGRPHHPDVLRRDVLYPVLDRLGLGRPPRSVGFHAFRHSAGSLINAETRNLKLAQKLLGHSNLNTTADIYTNTSAKAEREAVEAIEQAVFGNSLQVVPNPCNTTDSARPN